MGQMQLQDRGGLCRKNNVELHFSHAVCDAKECQQLQVPRGHVAISAAKIRRSQIVPVVHKKHLADVKPRDHVSVLYAWHTT